MPEQEQLQKKPSTAAVTTTQNLPDLLQTRPFAANEQTTQTNLQAKSSDRTSDFGHSFGNLPVFSSTKPVIQPKLTIGEPGDKYEQEADRVAADVVQRINQSQAVSPKQEKTVQRQEVPEEEELQMKPLVQRREDIGGGQASTDLESSINGARGGGQPLDKGLQRSMGQAMGADFSGVRVHTDTQADQLNQSIQAKAFTTGQDVFFRQGTYEPGSRGGQELIAHELTHVVQQNSGAVQRHSALQNTKTDVDSQASQKVIQRETDPATSIPDSALTEGSIASFSPVFGTAVVTVAPGAIKGSGSDEVNGKKVCVAGDEKSVIVPGCTYTTPQYSIPGTGMLSIKTLTSNKVNDEIQSGGKPVIFKGATFIARFQVANPAQQPSVMGSPVPDSTPEYSGTGKFI
ncbi:hypothetical protein NIES4101_78260 [Calothrix sp. NIES-4101]|nr:hypothetical protein NIES4101_78260 [Calothrix sp. NIES-4101]